MSLSRYTLAVVKNVTMVLSLLRLSLCLFVYQVSEYLLGRIWTTSAVWGDWSGWRRGRDYGNNYFGRARWWSSNSWVGGWGSGCWSNKSRGVRGAWDDGLEGGWGGRPLVLVGSIGWTRGGRVRGGGTVGRDLVGWRSGTGSRWVTWGVGRTVRCRRRPNQPSRCHSWWWWPSILGWGSGSGRGRGGSDQWWSWSTGGWTELVRVERRRVIRLICRNRIEYFTFGTFVQDQTLWRWRSGSNMARVSSGNDNGIVSWSGREQVLLSQGRSKRGTKGRSQRLCQRGRQSWSQSKWGKATQTRGEGTDSKTTPWWCQSRTKGSVGQGRLFERVRQRRSLCDVGSRTLFSPVFH